IKVKGSIHHSHRVRSVGRRQKRIGGVELVRLIPRRNDDGVKRGKRLSAGTAVVTAADQKLNIAKIARVKQCNDTVTSPTSRSRHRIGTVLRQEQLVALAD